MNKKLIILQLVTRRQYRGAEVFAANLSKELIELGHDIIFTGLYRNEIQELKVDQAVNLDLVNLKKGKFSIEIVRKLVKLVREYNPDVIQCNGSDTLKYMVAASFFLSKKAIFYRNISTISEWFSSPLQIALYRYLFSKVDHITSVGENARQDLIKTLKLNTEKVTVIRRGIPIKRMNKEDSYRNLRKELQIESSSSIAIHVGNFSPEKNHVFLLDVFEEVRKSTSKIKLACVGTGILYDKIKAEIEKRNLQDCVFLLGFRKDIPNLMAGSDLCLLSSKIEGVPGVILEAAAQAIPSISVNVGGVNEVMENGETGIIIPDYDPQHFARELLALMKNETKRVEMGENAYTNVLRYFDPVANARKFEGLYQREIH